MKNGGKTGMDATGRLAAERLVKQAPGPHMDAESLAAFAENALPDLERTQALTHLSACADCRQIVFLAQPQTATMQEVFTPAPGRSVVLFRWASGLAAVAIVGGGVFLARHELLRERTVTAHQGNVPQLYSNASENKAAAAQAEPQRELVPTTAPKTTAEANGRPEPKHMTAKLNGTMQFDSSDQILMSNAPAAPEALNLRAQTAEAQTANKTGLRDSAAPAAPAPSSYAFDKARARAETSDETVTVEVAGANASAILQPGAAQNGGVSSSGANKVAAGYVGGALSRAVNVPGAQWSLSPTGALQRSFDEGKSWREVQIQGARSGFRAVFSSGIQVWVGGNAGTLYHSTDSGLTWARVTPASADRKLSGDITHIEFADTQNGKVSTDGGEVWATADGGRSWTPQN